MKLSIIIPAYNEEKNIEKVIDSVKNVSIGMEKEIIIVEDFSSDKTGSIIKQRFSLHKEIKIVYHPENRGKGAAIRSGLKHASGDIVLIQDADLEYSIDDYPALIRPIIENEADVVYGSRFLGQISGMRFANWLANKILAKTANLLYGLNITDEATAYKVFRTHIIQELPLKCERFEFCPEVTAKIAKRGYKIHEVPVKYRGRRTLEGKKITAKDGFEAIWTLIKYRFKD